MEDLILKTEKKLHQENSILTCEICFEPITPPKRQFQNGNRCVHAFCTLCIIKHIQAKLQDNVSDIKCPHITCTHSLEPLSCRPKITHRLFNRWCDLLCKSTVLPFDSVYCPNNKCSELIVNEFGDVNLKRCVCPACLKPFCFRCKVAWHEGYTCEEKRDGNDYDVGAYCERKGWKRCPKCRHGIELSFRSICNIVKCKCGTRFCYKCGKKPPFWETYNYFYMCCRDNSVKLWLIPG